MDDAVVQEEGTKEEGEAQAVVKGKRSKRYRSPHGPVPTSSSSVESLTEEEQDMANCLMLLASGAGRRREETEEENSSGGRGSPITRKVAAQLYECKTCGKCFQSFQALGGHRTSHKKTKAAAVNGPQEQKKAKIWRDEEGLLQMRIAPSYGDDLVVGKPKMHECSICGSEFTSGQALGGHMRRHRPVVPPAPAYPNQPNKERSHLSLDLNLPAPPEDVEGGDYEKSPSSSSGGAADFEFPEKPQPGHVVSLMNCHY